MYDPTVWLGAALLGQAIVVHAAWWAVEYGGSERVRRVDAALAVGRWLYMGVLPLLAVALGVAPLSLAGWVWPNPIGRAVYMAAVAAVLGAGAVVAPARVARPPRPARLPHPSGGRGPAWLADRASDVVLREAHWLFVRAGVVAAAPGWFALPGGTHAALGQAVIGALLVLEAWANPVVRDAARTPSGRWAAAQLGAAAAASHLGWVLGGSAACGLAAHVVVALAGAWLGPRQGTDAFDGVSAVIPV